MYVTEDQFRAKQFDAYFSVSLWFFGAIVACDWASLLMQNCMKNTSHRFTSNFLLAYYSIHLDVLMRLENGGFEKSIFVLKSVTTILYNAINLNKRLNSITIMVAVLTVIHITHVYFMMNNMEKEYKCQVDPLRTNGTRNSILLDALMPKLA